MAERGNVGAGDLIRAMRALDLPIDALPAVAELFGLELPRARRTGPAEPPQPPPEPVERVAPAAALPDLGPAVEQAPDPPVPETGADARRPFELIEHPPLPDADAPPRTLRPLGTLVAPASGRPRPPAGLLDPVRERAILGAVIAGRRPGLEPDLDALIPKLAAGEAIHSIPRQQTRTTGLGVRLLVDAGVGMVPFRHDVDRTVAQIQRLAGADGVERLDFDRSPLGPRGVGPGPIWRWRAYADQRALARGRPVLVLTDLGLGGHKPERTARDWAAFAEEVAAAGSRLVLLVPYPPSRWPAGVAGIVHWDRATSVRAAVRAAR